MAKFREYKYESRTQWFFDCPGCGEIHTFSDAWVFNGDLDKPTVSPSILVTAPGNAAYRCHSFVKDGQIQFLDDCSHDLRGQTVEIPEWTKDGDFSTSVQQQWQSEDGGGQ